MIFLCYLIKSNQINKHTVKINDRLNYYKKVLLFFFTEYKNEWKEHKF